MARPTSRTSVRVVLHDRAAGKLQHHTGAGMTILFCIIMSAGFVATCLFGESAVHGPSGPTAFNIAGMCFGICLMLAAILLLPGA